jgi:hypothetical protein
VELLYWQSATQCMVLKKVWVVTQECLDSSTRCFSALKIAFCLLCDIRSLISLLRCALHVSGAAAEGYSRPPY